MRAAIQKIIERFEQFDADKVYDGMKDLKLKDEWDEWEKQRPNRRGPFPGPDLKDNASIEKAKHWAFQAAQRELQITVARSG